MAKKDCLIVYLDYCSKRSPYREEMGKILRYARINALRLILITRCTALELELQDLRQLSNDNMEFPVRLYEDASAEDVAKLEKCATFDVKTVDEINISWPVKIET
ncbi:hypothetical protein [Thermoproteus tenax]|uniref:Uncharacterized protein n=1 Tax=Thermoproteus tenax (strain ATCC 35583 / DSM 2078 / JCM 9277 / NBRC 100435 / Kra 1) TaxID=768679 RepID=G4RL27_THETK|nr:hypothetical protein [Thermoproteus tenax]CCC82272.1 hypothetical protein TTX_1651 [Thermoproteus tenax Kra 1]